MAILGGSFEPPSFKQSRPKNRDCKDCNELGFVAFLTQIDIFRV